MEFFLWGNLCFQIFERWFCQKRCNDTWNKLFNSFSCVKYQFGFYSFTYFNFYSFLTFIGSFIFFISDFILVRKMFYEDNKYYQISLMATYILAQSLICFGMSNKKNRIENEKKEKTY